MLKTIYLTGSRRWTESRLYFGFVRAMVAIGVSILLVGFTQPLALLAVSSSLSGLVMVVYSALLIQLNRKALPAALKVRGFRLGVMIVAVLFYGYFSARLVISYGGLCSADCVEYGRCLNYIRVTRMRLEIRPKE